MKIYLDSIGCRLNQAEIETYGRQFRQAGHELVDQPQEADLAVINTCAVTSQAVSDSRSKIRRAGAAGKAGVILTGCWSTLQPEQAAALPGVTRVVPNAQKDRLVAEALDVPPEAFDLEPLERQLLPGLHQRTRAFIKVQDGCDNRCAFCITTLARGAGRSRPVEAVLADIHNALQGLQGAREVVLTGVHLGSWGADLSPALHLHHLVQAILTYTDVPRLRLSSLEPWDLTENFFAMWQDDRLCPHLHLPLQSGSAATLRRMARKTTPSAFAALVETARSAIPGVAITTDLIAGFPGETEAEFAESLDFVQAQNFAGGHVFTYSARPGTAAARFPGQMPHPIRKARNARLREALSESAAQYRSFYIGQVLPVLWESAVSLGPQGWEMSGLTGNYLRIHAIAPQPLWNQITPVRMLEVRADHMAGVIEKYGIL